MCLRLILKTTVTRYAKHGEALLPQCTSDYQKTFIDKNVLVSWMLMRHIISDSVSLCLSGERPKCGEGWSPAGGQHDPSGRQQSHGQSCYGCPKP